MSEGNANSQDPFEGTSSRHREDPTSRTSRLSIEERSLIEELARGNQRRIAEALVSENQRPQASALDPSVDVSNTWRIVYNDRESQPILPPIDDLMSRLPEEHTRSTGYRRPDNSSGRNNRETHTTSILPPLPDNSDEAMDIEMTNQRMDETNGDRTARFRITDMSRARDLESLLGGEDDVFDFSRARFPSRLRHSATANSENPPAINARTVRDVDPSERRWLDMLYTRLPAASDNLSPHIRALLSRRAAAGETVDVPGGTALWNLMLQEDGSDEGEDDESDWERTSSPGEMSHRGTARNAAELLAELASTAGVSPRAAAQSQLEPIPTPSRPATNAHLRGTHVPTVVGTSNHVTSHTRTTGRNREPEGREESGFLAESSSSGASLRRRKSIKRRRVESGMNISYPYPIMTSANSESIARSNLPEYMQMINTPILAIPTTFNPLDKCVRLNISPSTSSDAAYGPLVTVKFIGTGARGDADAAAVRTDHPIPPTCGIYYYEATIVSKGQDGYISIGLSNRFTNLSRLVGWEPGSYAWHMDDGFVFEGRGEGTSKGWPTSTTGDVIGCGVDFTSGKAFFTKNGQMVGYAFKNIGPDDKLYPSIGLRTPGETVQCNFMGPFAYDIVTHVRKVKHDLLDAIMKKDLVNIKTEEAAETEAKPEQLSTVRSEGAATKDTLKKTTALGARPQQVIRNVDGALAPAVLSYLQHNGFFGSASAMRKDMNSRKRLLDTGVEDPSDAKQQKMAKTEKWYQMQEDSWRQLQNIKLDYTENRLSKVWNTLRDSKKSAVAYPHFLDSFDSLWACRIRTRYFLKIMRELLNRTDRGPQTVDQITLDLPELNEDPEFKLFLLGDSHKYLGSGKNDELDASSILLAIGHNLRAVHGNSSNPLVKQSIDSALSYMPYVSAADLPAEMYKHISKTALVEEAEELIKAIREHQGKPVKSALEEAFAAEDKTLRDLGITSHFAPATFLGVEDIVRGLK